MTNSAGPEVTDTAPEESDKSYSEEHLEEAMQPRRSAWGPMYTPSSKLNPSLSGELWMPNYRWKLTHYEIQSDLY